MSINREKVVFDLLNREETYIAINTIVNNSNKIVLWTQQSMDKICRDLKEISKEDKRVRQFLRYLVNQPEITYNAEEYAWELSERLWDILKLKEGQKVKTRKIEEKEKRENHWAYKNAVAELEVVDMEES